MGGRAPSPDKNVGVAALRSAETGQQMLDWMQSQATVTNQWAEEDRARDIETFRPLQDQFIQSAQTWDSQERQDQQADAAVADVNIGARTQIGAMNREAASMGIDPRSGRYASARGRMATDTALAGAGAANLSRRQVRSEGDARRAQAINLGAGFAVNPGTSMGLSNGAGQAGFGGAMQGYGQQANILNTDYQNRLQSWNANNSSMMSMFSGIGTLAGAFLSSKEYKTDKTPSRGNLEAMKKMPVEEWTYKPGKGDGGRHTGPYAEDFKAATGKGDGKSIPIQDMIGVTMGAVQELGAKVDQMAAKLEKPANTPPKSMGAMRMPA